MIIRLMYVLPMILGRTYDLEKNSVGVDIFPLEDIQKPMIIQESFYRSSFKTVETSSDVKEILEINGDLSLGIKAGLFAFRGAGSYVKESLSVQNSVDILTKVSFRTVSKTLPLSAKPVTSWYGLGKDNLGTHYVRSILYGGDLIAWIRFKAVKSEYLQDIRATITSSLSTGSALDLVGEGKLESLNKKLDKKATMEINYYATAPLEGVPNTIKGLRDLVRNFENHVQKENSGLGVPVEVELEDISTLNQTMSYIKNTDLETELSFFEEYLDDLLRTKSRLKTWIASLPPTLSKEQEEKISEFSERLSLVIRKFIETIANLDSEKGPSQLTDAKSAYKKGKGLAMAGKFARELKKLQNLIVFPNKTSEEKGFGVYTHYGASICGKDEHTTTVFSGYLASSPRNTTGSGFNYLCFPKLPSRNAHGILEDSKSPIAGVKYGLLEAKPFKINEDDTVLRGVVCAACLVKDRPVIHIFLGQGQCPEGNQWTLQYNGYIMSSMDASRSENICVDTKHGSHKDSDPGYFDQSISFVLEEKSGQRKFIQCAVCSK